MYNERIHINWFIRRVNIGAEVPEDTQSKLRCSLCRNGGNMKGIFDLESPFIQFLDSATDLVILNAVCLLCCIPVFTIGASLSALHFVLMKMIKHEDAYNVRTFFAAFRRNFKQSTLLWLPFLAISGIIVGDAFLMLRGGVEIPQAAVIVVGIIYFVIVLIMMYAVPMISRYENSTKQILKNSLLICMLNLPKTLGMVLIYAAPFALWYFSAKSIIFLLILGISGPAYCNARILKGIYEQYEYSEEKEVTAN